MLTIVTAASDNDLVDLDRVKLELGIAESETGEDDKLAAMITEASAMVAAYCNRTTFGVEELRQTERLSSAREYLVLARDLAVEIDAVEVDGATLAPEDYELDGPLLYRLQDDARTCWGGKVVVSYTAGFDIPLDAPTALSRAALDLVVNLYRGAGRDTSIRTEMVEGVGSTSYTDLRANAGLPLSAERIRALERYRLVSVG